MKYITVKFTEDQLNHLFYLVEEQGFFLSTKKKEHVYIEKGAFSFNKRLQSKLEKAKS